MKYLISFLSYAFCFHLAYAGDVPPCPKGTVWDGIACVNVCPEGYEWNEKGKCVKKGPGVNGAAKCKQKDDAYFTSVSTGCRHETNQLIFGNISKRAMTYQAAKVYCNRIEADKKDWRLPNAEELEMIAGETIAGHYLSFCTDENFWTSTETEEEQSSGEFNPSEPYRVCISNRVVNLYTGISDWKHTLTVKSNKELWDKLNTARVVCVRNEKEGSK